MNPHPKLGWKNLSRKWSEIVYAKKSTLLLIAFLAIFALAPLITWYQNGYIIARGDYVPFLDVQQPLSSSLFSLWSNHGIGEINQNTKIAPLFLFYKILSDLGLSIGLSQAIEYASLVALSGIGMFLFTNRCFPKVPLAAPIASAIFVVSPLMLMRTNIAMAWTFALLPLIFGILKKSLTQEQKTKQIQTTIKAALLLALLTGIASINLPTIAIIAIGIALFYFFELVTFPQQFKRTLVSAGFLLGVSFFLSLYWIYPTYYELSETLGGSTTSIGAELRIEAYRFVHTRASILNVMSFTGSWGWLEIYMPYIRWYNGPVQKILFLVPTICITIGSVLIKQLHNTEKKRFLLFFLTILGIIFLETGIHPPGENIWTILYDSIPGFFLFREPITKFGILHLILLAPLFGVSITIIYQKFQKYSNNGYSRTIRTTLTIAILSLIILQGFPFITGEVNPDATSKFPYGSHVQIPTYWNEAASEINQKYSGQRILSSPENSYYQTGYDWGFYGTDVILGKLLTNPVIVREDSAYVTSKIKNELVAKYFNARRNGDSKIQNTILSLLQTNLLLQKNDVENDYQFPKFLPFRGIEKEKELSQKTGILINQWGELELRKLGITTSNIWISVLATPIPKQASTDDLIEIADNLDELGIMRTTIVEENVFNQIRDGLTGEYIISDIKYRPGPEYDHWIDITNAPKDQHIIVFPFKFDSNWKLFLQNTELQHIKVNGYMNGYIVPKNTGKNYAVRLVFSAQRNYQWCLLVTILGIIGSGLVIGYSSKS